MLTWQQSFQMIEEDAIIAGMRGNFPPDVALQVCATLFEEGIRVFEFTMNSAQPLEAMTAVKRELGDEACVGMGTVIDVETANRVLDTGLDFIVSPVYQPAVLETVMARDVLMVPGVITPTEAQSAWDSGAKLIKLFPIGALGIDYFRAMFAPLSHLKVTCNGAMNDENAAQFIQAGAVAAGMSGWLTGDGTWSASKLRSRARVLQNAIDSALSDD